MAPARVAEPLADQAARGEGACRTAVEGDGAVGVRKRFGVVAGEIVRPGAIVEGERGSCGASSMARA